MRILPEDEHQIRKEKILQAVIHLFIKTGKPVGSTSIVSRFHMGLSPASIRHVLADLEKEGFLTHPHTSAGRVPTDIGYRFYVNSIVKIQRLAEEEEKRIRHQYTQRMQEIEELMKQTTQILSSLSHCTGFAIKPRLIEERLRRIELVPVSQNQVLGVLVSDSGMVRNQMISLNQSPNDEALRFASRFLTDQLKGLNINDAHERFISELQKFQAQQMAQRDFLETLSQHLFDASGQSSVYVEGTSNILNFPEFQDLDSLRSFAYLVDKKEALAEVFNQELDRKGLQVRIGKEASPELKDFSVVSSSYRFRGRPVGVLGILGPKRMEYQRMMSIVSTVTELVNRFLHQHDRDLLEELHQDDD
ncbi:hypothetical protein BVX98_02855 [bacterium F11]|nr:hypothetical protein BVX98_02855 [bacterium F11]